MTREPAPIPMLEIIIALEAAPKIVARWDRNEAVQENRMRDWVTSHPDYREIFDRACELSRRDRTEADS